LLPIAGVAWWLNRPRGEAVPNTALTDLDVVCLGRVDGLAPVAALEPAAPGRVVAVLVSEGQAVKAGDQLLKLDDESLRLKAEEAQAAVAAADAEVEAARLEQKLHPRRVTTQEAAVTAAGERVAAARKLYDEKKKAQSFNTVTPAELIAAEAEVKQLEQLEGAEKARLDEYKLADPGLRVKAAG